MYCPKAATSPSILFLVPSKALQIVVLEPRSQSQAVSQAFVFSRQRQEQFGRGEHGDRAARFLS